MLEPFLYDNHIEAGCDEAGRGCLAGPVFAAAVILPKEFRCEDLNDSKQLTEKKRYSLRKVIEDNAISWSVGIAEAPEIDQINILNASFLAMHRAICNLKEKPEYLIIDGNRFRYIKQIPLKRMENPEKVENEFQDYPEIPFACIVKGDGKYMSIAAASILAKTYRDDYMKMLDKRFPQYNWGSNKGYPTSDHREAIGKFGITEFHRKSFRLTDDQLEINF